MPRVIGVDIPGNKRLEIALTYIYGIGRYLSNEIIAKLSLDSNKRAKMLTENEISEISVLLQSEYVVEGDLRRSIANNIKRLQSIHSYRGLRHRKKLPVRGQHTRNNARTHKGRVRTIAGKKRAPTPK